MRTPAPPPRWTLTLAAVATLLASIAALPAAAAEEDGDGGSFDYHFTFATREGAVEVDAEGATDPGGVGTGDVPLDVENLTRVRFTLSWSVDLEEDADLSVRLAVTDPSGERAGQTEGGGANGELTVETTPADVPGDVVVRADSDDDAWAALSDIHGPTDAGKGTWTVRVEFGEAEADGAVDWTVRAEGDTYAAQLEEKKPVDEKKGKGKKDKDEEDEKEDEREEDADDPTPPPPGDAQDATPEADDRDGDDASSKFLFSKDLVFSTPVLAAGGALIGVCGALAVGLRRQ